MNSTQEIRIWLQDGENRERFLDDMVWLIHDRFGMVCSTTTCSKIKRKWLKVIEAEERGETLDPAEAQEQVCQEALRVGKKSPVSSQKQQGENVSPPRAEMDMPAAMELAIQQQQQQQQQQPLPQFTANLDQNLQTPMDQQLQEQLQTEVAHAAVHQSNL
jgi:hypothetical protein